jgi:ABC-type branched-subunit amino acid transport system substrate-binding protein
MLSPKPSQRRSALARQTLGLTAAVAFASAVLTAPSQAQAAKAGGKCTKAQVGKTTTAGGATLECKKSGSAGRWVRVTATTAAPTTQAPVTTVAAPTTAAPSGGATVGTGASGQGVTENSIKIGFMDAAFATPSGFLPTSTGDATTQINAVVDYINANGGIGGRKITPVIRKFNLSANNDATAAALCAAFADDDKVFAVSSQSVIVSSAARECFSKKKVVYLEGAGSWPIDTKTLARMAPYGYVTNIPAVDRPAVSYIKMLLDEGYFGSDPKAAKVGLISMDDPAYKFAAEKAEAELKKAGIELVDKVFFDTTSQDTVSRDGTASAPRFAAKGITHVISMASGGNSMQFMWAAEDNKYFPRMAFTSFDNLRIVQNGSLFRIRVVSKDNLRNSIAIGFNPVTDTEDKELIFPQPGPEKTCIDLFTNRQLITGFESRYNSRYAQSYCDNMVFLKTVADNITGPLNAEAISAQVAKLGSKGFDASVGWLTVFGPNRFDGGNGYRVLKFDTSCTKSPNGCFGYSGAVKPFA